MNICAKYENLWYTWMMFITSFDYILGFLSDSYIVEVTYSMKYREDDADHSVESWFVKVTIIVLRWDAFMAFYMSLYMAFQIILLWQFRYQSRMLHLLQMKWKYSCINICLNTFNATRNERPERKMRFKCPSQ